MPLDVSVEDSVNTILSHIDNMMQYGEDEEPAMPKDMDEGKSEPFHPTRPQLTSQAISTPTFEISANLLYQYMHIRYTLHIACN